MFFRKEQKKKKRFEEIYDSYVEQVYRFIFLKTGSKDEAEDITSKTFMRVWETVKRENPETGMRNPRAYTYRIARNLLVDYYRSKREGNVSTDDVVIKDESMRADERAELNSEMEQVRNALSNLNEDYQDIIIWYYLNELSIQEIADITGKSETNVRVTAHRAISALKKEMGV